MHRWTGRERGAPSSMLVRPGALAKRVHSIRLQASLGLLPGAMMAVRCRQAPRQAAPSAQQPAEAAQRGLHAAPPRACEPTRLGAACKLSLTCCPLRWLCMQPSYSRDRPGCAGDAPWQQGSRQRGSVARQRHVDQQVWAPPAGFPWPAARRIDASAVQASAQAGREVDPPLSTAAQPRSPSCTGDGMRLRLLSRCNSAV